MLVDICGLSKGMPSTFAECVVESNAAMSFPEPEGGKDVQAKVTLDLDPPA